MEEDSPRKFRQQPMDLGLRDLAFNLQVLDK